MPLYEVSTAKNFEASLYLEANIDLSSQIFVNQNQREEWAKNHFLEFGQHEGRLQFSKKFLEDARKVQALKIEKILERSPRSKSSTNRHSYSIGSIQFEALIAKKEPTLPLKMEVISANEYDPEVIDLLESDPKGLFLDLGAGLRSELRSNVVNVEIDALITTDVIAWGEKLPFRDKTFDGAVCLAVLEHVKDPFAVAAELVRVVRPGGTIIVDWPFLQPVHGYPHHYFNATMDGAREAFLRNKRVVHIDSNVPGHMHPAFSLTWMLNNWKNSLNEEQSNDFSRTTVDEILSKSPEEIIEGTSWGKLPQSSQATISSGSRLIITAE